MAVKNTLITAGISVLGTIAIGGVKALQDLTITTPAPVYSAPQPLTMSDWLWYQVMWWLLPVAGGAFVFALAKGKTGGRKQTGENQPDWFSRWLVMSQQSAAQKATEDTPPVVHWLKAKEALNASTERKWVLGQAVPQQPNQETAKLAGQLFTVDYQTTQFAILGGSGGGKTSTGLLLLIYCKMFGLHTIVLDGKDGLDWGPLGDMGIVEWYSMTPDNLKSFLEKLNAIYKERHAIMRQAGVSKIYDLPPGRRLQPLFVIMEEFGRTWERVNYDKEIGTLFNDLFCLGRAAGIILCPIDQAPEEWTKAMRSNAKTAICYPAQGEALKAFGEHHMSKLPQVGVFSRGNVFYRSWFFGESKDVRRLPKIQRRYLSLQRSGSTNGSSNDEFEDRLRTNPVSNASNDSLQVVQTASNASNPQTFEKTATPVATLSMIRAFERLKRWDEPSRMFFRTYPKATQADLRSVMAEIDNKPTESYKAEAFKWYHVYSPAGDRSKLIGKFGMTEDSVKGMKLS